MLRRILLSLLPLALTFIATRAADYDTNPICGKYRATEGGGVIEIIPMSQLEQPLDARFKVRYSIGEQYVVVLNDNPSPSLAPGTVMGWLAPLAKPGKYDAVLMTKEKDGRLTSPRRFLLELNADGTHLSMLEIKHRVRIDPLRFLPYVYHGISLKGTLKMEDNRPDDVGGFIKFFPRPAIPHSPRPL